jgi:hypothetical protein
VPKFASCVPAIFVTVTALIAHSPCQIQNENVAIVKERDTGLECTEIRYLFSPLFRGADN